MRSALSDVQVFCREMRSNMRVSADLRPFRWVSTFLVLVLFGCLRRCPLTASSKLGAERRPLLRPPFLGPLLVEQAVLSLNRAAWNFSELSGDVAVSGQTI